MELVYQVAAPPEMEEILAFAQRRLTETEVDPIARRFAEWNAPWRIEALEHYLKLGWSFTARTSAGGELVGFFLGQPFLFMRGQTQTLWIEYLDAKHIEERAGLVDVAIRLAREKHLQRVLFAGALAPILKQDGGAVLRAWTYRPITEEIIEVPTTKG